MNEHDEYNPPDEAIQALARCLFPAIRAYFESECGQREFAQWRTREQAAVTSEKLAETADRLRRAG